MSHSLPSKSSIPTSESLDHWHGDELYASLVGQERLCQGSAADLFLARIPKQQIQVVKKVMRVAPTYFGGEITSSGQRDLDQIRASFSKTFGRWCLLENPYAYIIKMFFVDTKELTLYKEYCTNGDLRQHCKQIQSDFRCDKILRDIIGGLAYLHSQTPPIVHGCINPGNIYITGDFKVKLGEPSCSQLVVGFSHLTPSISVDWLVRWMSPEFFEGEPLTTQSDMWSLGCTFLEIITGRLPYHRFKSNTEVLEQILSDVSPDLGESFESPREGLGKNYAETVHQLAKKCWLPALNRPSIQELREELSVNVLKYMAIQATPPVLSIQMSASSEATGGGFRGKAIPEDPAGQTIFASNPGVGSYDAAAGSSYPTESDWNAPQARRPRSRAEGSHETNQFRSRKYLALQSSNWLEQLNIWSDRAKLKHIEFTTTPIYPDVARGYYVTPQWKAIPIFPEISRMSSGMMYGKYAHLHDAAVIGRGDSIQEAREDSARKLLELSYCYY